jgi:hypothetical protein
MGALHGRDTKIGQVVFLCILRKPGFAFSRIKKAASLLTPVSRGSTSELEQ